MSLLVITDTALIIGALISLVGSITAGTLSYQSNKKANETNVDLSRETNEFNRQQVLDQREYDSPANFIQRLTSAGLNPNLAYGNSSSSSAATGSSAQVSPMDYSPFFSAGSDIINASLQNRALNIQQQKVDQEGKLADSAIRHNEAAIVNLNADTEVKDADRAYLQVLCDKVGTEIENMNQQTENLKKQWSVMDEQQRSLFLQNAKQEIDNAWAEVFNSQQFERNMAEIRKFNADASLSEQEAKRLFQLNTLTVNGVPYNQAIAIAGLNETEAHALLMKQQELGVKTQNGIMSWELSDKAYQHGNGSIQTTYGSRAYMQYARNIGDFISNLLPIRLSFGGSKGFSVN